MTRPQSAAIVAREVPTAPIGPKTVTVLGSHWRESSPWDGFDWSRAEVRSHNILSCEDYHLGVPWAHPEDRRNYNNDPGVFGIYRLRLKRGWRSFIKTADGIWMVSNAPAPVGVYGTPPGGQVSFVLDVGKGT